MKPTVRAILLSLILVGGGDDSAHTATTGTPVSLLVILATLRTDALFFPLLERQIDSCPIQSSPMRTHTRFAGSSSDVCLS